jgi:hypothetical protein
MAKAGLILFTDDDCIPSFFWIENFLNAYGKNEMEEIAFAGQVNVPLPDKPTDHEKNMALLERGSFVTAIVHAQKKHLRGLVAWMKILRWHGEKIPRLNLIFLRIIYTL